MSTVLGGTSNVSCSFQRSDTCSYKTGSCWNHRFSYVTSTYGKPV